MNLNIYFMLLTFIIVSIIFVIFILLNTINIINIKIEQFAVDKLSVVKSDANLKNEKLNDILVYLKCNENDLIIIDNNLYIINNGSRKLNNSINHKMKLNNNENFVTVNTTDYIKGNGSIRFSGTSWIYQQFPQTGITNAFTVSFFIKITDAKGFKPLISQSVKNPTLGWRIIVEDANLKVLLGTNQNDIWQTIITINNFVNATNIDWSHVILTYNINTNPKWNIYIDGLKQFITASDTTTNMTLLNLNTPKNEIVENKDYSIITQKLPASETCGIFIGSYYDMPYYVTVERNSILTNKKFLNLNVSGIENKNYDINYISGNEFFYLRFFNETQTFSLPITCTADILIVGGGGGGGYAAGGGGGGGEVLYYTNRSDVKFKTGGAISLTAGKYEVTVGNGGNGSDISRSSRSKGLSSKGLNGFSSKITYTNNNQMIAIAKGGGGGGSYNMSGNGGDVGGAGGIGANVNSKSNTIVTSINGGGSAFLPGTYSKPSTNYYSGGSGGGGGFKPLPSSLKDGTNSTGGMCGEGNGGRGENIDITGTSIGYGGGGGGGSAGLSAKTYCLGGIGYHGGGAGGTSYNSAKPGINNTGGGGGGGTYTGNNPTFENGGNGGSGVVIFRFKLSDFIINNQTIYKINSGFSYTPTNVLPENTLLDDLRIYDFAVTDMQVKTLYYGTSIVTSTSTSSLENNAIETTECDDYSLLMTKNLISIPPATGSLNTISDISIIQTIFENNPQYKQTFTYTNAPSDEYVLLFSQPLFNENSKRNPYSPVKLFTNSVYNLFPNDNITYCAFLSVNALETTVNNNTFIYNYDSVGKYALDLLVPDCGNIKFRSDAARPRGDYIYIKTPKTILLSRYSFKAVSGFVNRAPSSWTLYIYNVNNQPNTFSFPPADSNLKITPNSYCINNQRKLVVDITYENESQMVLSNEFLFVFHSTIGSSSTEQLGILSLEEIKLFEFDSSDKI